MYRFFGAIHIRSSKHDHVQAMLRKDGTIDVYGGTVLVPRPPDVYSSTWEKRGTQVR